MPLMKVVQAPQDIVGDIGEKIFVTEAARPHQVF
jgi:hypothetical protein